LEPAVPGQHVFPRSERLTRRQEYLQVYQQGEKQVGPQFICYTLRQAGQGRKIGFAVSRKVGGAVTRNRMKRYLREIYRTARPEMADGMCAVIVARPASVELDYQQCEQAVRRLLRAGGLLNG
jgi:ribonuclease P protein component